MWFLSCRREKKGYKKKFGRTRGKEGLISWGLSVAPAIMLLEKRGLQIGFSGDEMEWWEKWWLLRVAGGQNWTEGIQQGQLGTWNKPQCLIFCWPCIIMNHNNVNNLTLSLLMSYIYMELLVQPEILTSYIYGPTFGNSGSRLFLFAAQCFNTESIQKVIMSHSCV
jgi:hypothetical protein